MWKGAEKKLCQRVGSCLGFYYPHDGYTRLFAIKLTG